MKRKNWIRYAALAAAVVAMSCAPASAATMGGTATAGAAAGTAYGNPSNDASPLRQVHGNIFYLHKQNMDMSIEEQLRRAQQLIVTGTDYPLAVAVLDEVITQNAQVSEAYILRGIAKTEMDKFAEAEKDYKAALMIEPDNPTFYYYRGRNYLLGGVYEKKWYSDKMRQYESARQQFQKALEIEPYYLDARVGMGDAYAEQGKAGMQQDTSFNPEQFCIHAIEQYNKVLTIVPNHDIVNAKKTEAQEIVTEYKAKQAERERQREIAQRIG
jgi:tetratricopeptide (TPR) repeat protein